MGSLQLPRAQRLARSSSLAIASASTLADLCDRSTVLVVAAAAVVLVVRALVARKAIR